MRTKSIGRKAALVFQALTTALGLGALNTLVSLALPGTALAACDPNDMSIQGGANCSQANGTSNNLFAPGGVFQTVANALIFIVGAVSVVMLIVGGLRYVISNGDSKNVEAAKNTILYAIVGIVVAVISFALVNFVINALSKAQG